MRVILFLFVYWVLVPVCLASGVGGAPKKLFNPVVQGSLTTPSITDSGSDVTVTTPTTVSNTLDVSGATTVGNTLDVTGTVNTPKITDSSTEVRIKTNTAIGADIAPTNKAQVHNSTAGGTSYAQITNSTTGATANDGVLVGVDSSGNAKIRNQENTNLELWTNNTQRVTVDNAGKVGIGTADPGAGLDVNTTARVQNAVAPIGGEGIELSYIQSTNTGTIYSYDRSAASWGKISIGGSPLVLNGDTSTENYAVGVGVNSPKSVSSAYSSMQVGNSVWLMSGEGSSSTVDGMYLTANANYDGSWRYMITEKAASIQSWDGNIHFEVAPSGTAGDVVSWATAMSLFNTGGVVIGGASGGDKGAGTLNTQGAIYENGNRQTIYSGSLYSDGTASDLPPSWSSSKVTTGQYRITHNMGTLQYVPMPASGVVGVVPLVCGHSTNYFDICFRDSATKSASDAGSYFMVHRHDY